MQRAETKAGLAEDQGADANEHAREELRIPAQVWPAVVAGAALALHRKAPLRPLLPKATARPLGAATFLAGMGLNGWAIAALKRSGVDPHHGHLTPRVVTTGPYAVSRNPVYLGGALAQAGLAIAVGWTWGLILAPVSVLLVDRIVVRPEERFLESEFPEYVEYRQRVRRWL